VIATRPAELRQLVDANWQFPSPDGDGMHGRLQGMEHFVDAVRRAPEPLSGALLAHETVEVIYGAYVSATGGRVDLKR
jgi:hypothetical protein